VRDETGTVTVASYQAPLATLGLQGQALTIVASGFLNPDQNSSGPAFGLYVALADGGELIPLSQPTGVNNVFFSESLAAYPNPASDYVTLDMNLANPGNVRLEMLDLLGKTINNFDLGWQSSLNYRIDVSGMPKGIYFLKVNTGITSYIEKLIITR
jgi:hypothetical protein